MTIRYVVAAVGILAGAALVARAQEPAPVADPTADAVAVGRAVVRGASLANVVPGSFRAQLVVDNRFKQPVKESDGTESLDPRNRTGKMHCLVCEYGLSPVVAVFVRADLKGVDAGSGLGKLIKGVDSMVPKYRADKLSSFAMFLKLEGGPKLVTIKGPDGSETKVEATKEYPDDEKRDIYAKEIRDFANAVGADNVPFGLAPTVSPSITAFNIGETTPVTIIIYNRFRTAQRWELKLDELTDEKIGEIFSATEKMITGASK